MSIEGPFNYTLGKREHRQISILQFLANEGPHTINEMARKLGIPQSTTHISTTSLSNGKMVQKVDTKHYRGQDFNLIWLSRWGVIRSLDLGFDPQPIRKTLRKYWMGTELEFMELLCEASETVNPHYIGMFFEFMESSRKHTDDFFEAALIILNLLGNYPSLLKSFRRFVNMSG